MSDGIEYEKETDGRWIAEVREVPGALAYGRTKKEAGDKARKLANDESGGPASKRERSARRIAARAG